MRRTSLLLRAALIAGVLPAAAVGGPTEPATVPVWLVGLGQVWAPDPYAGHEHDAHHGFPLVGYMGSRLTWLGPSVAYRVLDRRALTVRAAADVRFEGIDKDIARGPLRGVHAREPAFEVGMDVAWGPLFTAVRTDASGRHEGSMISVALRKEWRPQRRWQLSSELGAVWKDARLTDYLYGVDASETAFGLARYEADAALSYRAALSVTYPVNERWIGFGSLTYQSLPGEITSSPIVDQDHQVGVFVGAAYRLRARRAAEAGGD